MNIKNIGIVFLIGAVCSSAGCVQSRPSRNGVFNENQYVRKDFLTRPAADGSSDPGWLMKTTITSVSSPNPLGSDFFFLAPGTSVGANLVRFRVTQDKLEMLNMREVDNLSALPGGASPESEPEVMNAWPVTNTDIKYRINLDGEITNFIEENQELDWQQRQWVKLNFAKNDMSDLAPLGQYETNIVSKCVDGANSSATLVDGSFLADTKNDYLQWKVRVTLPLIWNDADCVAAYGQLGILASQAGKDNVTLDLMYSMVRATTPTYVPLVLEEKDPIRHKYGAFGIITVARDPVTQLLGGRQLISRFDPKKPIIWYFDPSFPGKYKDIFTGPKGVKEQTNALLEKAGVAARVDFKEPGDGLPDGAPPRQNGDIRFNFLSWYNDREVSNAFLGVTTPITDPRTGEMMNCEIAFNDELGYIEDAVRRVDTYLQSIGATPVDANGQPLPVTNDMPWPDGPAGCQDGDTLPIVPATVARNHNGNSSVYSKMQQYLNKPVGTYGNLGPQDFIFKQDDDFYRAYFALLPYQIFSDPDANPYVIREGGAGVFGPTAMWKKLQQERAFQEKAASIDRGETPYVGTGPAALQNATTFLNDFKALTLAHRDFNYGKRMARQGKVFSDPPNFVSFEQVASTSARHCVKGQWETKQQWIDSLIRSFWSLVFFHEFGHSLGLEHNFMASVDKPNFPHYKDAAGRDHVGLFASSVMEYNTRIADLNWNGGWAPYDSAAIAWLYANDKSDGTAPSSSITGQTSTTSPWKDPLGFSADGKTEINYLLCTPEHEKYTPLCRTFDLGTTPSEIIANTIDEYEWQYQWRNFRSWRKYWNAQSYADAPAATIMDMRKFISLWEFDWSSSELADTFRRVGLTNPDPNGSALQYYTQLTDKFESELSTANQMVGVFHKAIIQQSSGERPFRTIYDKYYGDVTQQGIILDKLFAMQGWVALWPTDNYDQNQAGDYFASYSGIGDTAYAAVAEDSVSSMIGGQYDVYPYFVPLAVAQFAQDTHDPAFGGRVDARDWIGGHVFYRLDDFLAYFRDLAVQYNQGCTDVKSCAYDPRLVADTHNEFVGPDARRWIWAYVADRNTWVAVQRDRNIAAYVIVRNYTDDVIYQMDDGAFPGGAYGVELPLKFFLDSFNLYN